MKNIGFLFDLDGVLIDSESEYSRIWTILSQEFPTGIESFDKVIKGCTLDKILNDYFPGEELQVRLSSRLHELEGQMKYDYLPGAKEFLEELTHRKLKKALVTSSDNTKMHHLQEEIPEIINFFDFLVTADKVTESKPSPQGYLLAAKELGKEVRNCAVFEDSLQGVMAGKNAGAFVVGVYGTLPAETIAPYSDLLVGNLIEIDLDSLIITLENR